MWRCTSSGTVDSGARPMAKWYVNWLIRATASGLRAASRATNARKLFGAASGAMETRVRPVQRAVAAAQIGVATCWRCGTHMGRSSSWSS